MPSAPALLLSALLVWATIPYGSVTPAGELILRWAAFALLALAVLRRSGNQALRRAAGPAMAITGLGLLGLLQSLSWPSGLVELLSPEHLHLARRAGLGATADLPSRLPLSLAPAQSRSVALTLASLAALLVVGASIGRRRRGRRWLAAALAAAALVQLAVGASRLLAGSAEPPASALVVPTNRLLGTYANPNHLALFFEIALAVCGAGLWWAWRRARRSSGLRGMRVLLAGLLTGAVLLALILTRSRAGILAAAAGIAVQAAVVALLGRSRWRRLAVAAMVTVGTLTAVGAVLRPHLGRLLETPWMEVVWSDRTLVSRQTLEIWALFPLLGSGMGTFEEAYPLVQSHDLTRVGWTHAHNDWAEALATGGLAAVGLIVFGLVALLRRLRTNLLEARRSEDQAAVLAAFGALTAVGIHELLDFGLTIPANAAALAAVCGAAAGVQVRPRPADGRSRGSRHGPPT